MSRSDTFVGLSPAALKLVEGCGKKHLTGTTKREEVVIEDSCRYTTIQDFSILESCVKVVEGFFTAEGFNTYPLSKYTFRDGSSLQEVEQISRWDSGPTIYTCLADTHGNFLIESQWSGEELESFHPGDSFSSEEEEQTLLERY